VEELERKLVERAKEPAPAEDPDAVKRKLAEARVDAQRAREEARNMLARAQGLLEELHQNRSTFDEAQRERDRQRGEISKLEAVFRGERTLVEAELDAPTGPAPTEAVEPPVEATALHDEIHRLQESLVRARSERDTMKSHLGHVREELDETRRDNERVREEALRERTARLEQVRELEAALVARHEEVEGLRESQKTLTDEVEDLRTQVAEGAGVVERLMALLGAQSAPEAPTEPAAEAETLDNGRVERADFGESLRLAPKRSAGVHHVEELRGSTGPGYPKMSPPPDDAGDGDDFYRGAAKTA
jgi:chromosome segregation ATPase